MPLFVSNRNPYRHAHFFLTMTLIRVSDMLMNYEAGWLGVWICIALSIVGIMYGMWREEGLTDDDDLCDEDEEDDNGLR